MRPLDDHRRGHPCCESSALALVQIEQCEPYSATAIRTPGDTSRDPNGAWTTPSAGQGFCGRTCPQATWSSKRGLNGRTTVWSDPLAEYRDGKHLLLPCLETHKPLDLVILMLGTNDLKRKFSASPYDIARGVTVLITIIRTSNSGADGASPEILLLCPPPVGKLTEFAEMFEGAEEKSRQLARHYRSVASEFGCHFLNTGDIIRSSDLDGIHLEASEHAKLGAAVAGQTRSILGVPRSR